MYICLHYYCVNKVNDYYLVLACDEYDKSKTMRNSNKSCIYR